MLDLAQSHVMAAAPRLINQAEARVYSLLQASLIATTSVRFSTIKHNRLCRCPVLLFNAMRLINVATLQLSEFWGDDIPPYAILSHRWGQEEVSFEQLSLSLTLAEGMKGFQKIRYCAAQAKTEGLNWCWVDTCCIDKRSSSELSEAINSMFQWYRNAEYCYVYLDDIFPSTAIIESKWFSRGWTLQELIAPKRLTFYCVSWTCMGDRSRFSQDIFLLCGIDRDILNGEVPISRASIAQRMRWAANRKTTRIEDIAYCLMGIFDVNMPLLYGEGRRAFTRLQEEIIKRSVDQSIFCWTDQSATRTTLRGLLARSPDEFHDCQDIKPIQIGLVEPFTVTNKGLHISLPIEPTEPGINRLEYFAILGCRAGESNLCEAVRLRRLALNSDIFIRVDPHERYTQGNFPKAGTALLRDKAGVERPVGSSIFSGVHRQESKRSNPLLTALYVPDKVPMPLYVDSRLAGIKFNIETVGLEQCGMSAPYGLQKELNLVRFDSGTKAFQARFLFQTLARNSTDQEKRILVCFNYKYSSIRTYSHTTVGEVEASYDINREHTTKAIKMFESGSRLIDLRVKSALVEDELMLIVSMRVDYATIRNAK
jgi:hypothetical protein